MSQQSAKFITTPITSNTTGTASNVTATSNSTITTLTALSLPGSQVTGNISGNAANITATSNATLTTLSSLSLPYSQITGAPSAGFDAGIYGDGSDGAATLNGTNTVSWAQLFTQRTFTVTAAIVYAGDVYTNNSQFFIVKTTSSGTSMVTYGTGAPTASGTLTFFQGSGQGAATVTYSSAANSTATNAYLITRSPYLTNLTLNSGTTLFNNLHAIRGTGTLTVNSGAIISNVGGAGLVGGISGGVATQGAAGQPGPTLYGVANCGSNTITSFLPSVITTGELGASAASPPAATGTVSTGADSGGASIIQGFQALGGNGGNGGAGTAGAGGTGFTTISNGNFSYTPKFLLPTLTISMSNTSLSQPSGGTSGSVGASGAGDLTNAGGGGGSAGMGGGIIALYFPTISNAGSITANGGAGGAGESPAAGNTGGGGGGGGGAGGLLYAVANTFSGAGTYTATGGALGAAGVKHGTGVNGTAGTAGAAGKVLRYQTSTQTWL